MSSRSTSLSLTFASPFRIPGLDGSQPAGTYRVDLDEETIEEVSRLVWRRTASFIHLPAVGTASTVTQMVPIAPSALDALIERDRTTP